MNAGLIFYLFILLPSFVLYTNAEAEVDNSSRHSYIVFMSEKPAGLSPESYYIRVLSSVCGSEEAAKEALIYAYRNISGFSAKLNDEQVDRIKKMAGVVYVKEVTSYWLDDPKNNGRVGQLHTN